MTPQTEATQQIIENERGVEYIQVASDLPTAKPNNGLITDWDAT